MEILTVILQTLHSMRTEREVPVEMIREEDGKDPECHSTAELPVCKFRREDQVSF